MVWQIKFILGEIDIVVFYNYHFDNQNYLLYTILSYVVLLFGYNKIAENSIYTKQLLQCAFKPIETKTRSTKWENVKDVQ